MQSEVNQLSSTETIVLQLTLIKNESKTDVPVFTITQDHLHRSMTIRVYTRFDQKLHAILYFQKLSLFL